LNGSYKQATPKAGPGDTIDYEIHLVNSGDKLVENLHLIDPLPVGSTYDSHDPGFGSNTFIYNPSLGRMEWTGNLAPNQELVFYFTVTVDYPRTPTDVITNIATIEWGGESLHLSAETEFVNKLIYMPLINR